MPLTPPRFLARWPLKRVLYAVVFCAVCPALLVISFYGVVDYRRAMNSTQDQTRNLVRYIANQQQILAENTRILLYTLSRLPEVVRADQAAMHNIFKELRKVHSTYSNISFVDMNGYLISSSNEFKPPITAYDRKYFKDAVKTKSFSAGEFVVGRVVTDPIFQFSAPVLDAKGDMTGVLVATIKLDHFGKLFSDVVLPPSWRFALLDHKGLRLYRFPASDLTPLGQPASRPNFDAVMKTDSDEGTYTATGPEGISMVYSFFKLRLTPQDPVYMTIVVGFPATSAAELIRSKSLPALLLLLASMGGALLIARLLGRMTIGSGIERLTRATRRLTGGDLSVRIGDLPSCGEVRELGLAFDQMAAELARESDDRRLAEWELTRAQNYIVNILDSMPSALVGVDPGGSVTHWNKAAEEATGITADGARGRDVSSVLAAMAHHLDAIQAAIEQRRPQFFEREAYVLDGETFYRDITIYPLIGNGIDGAVIRMDDVTRRTRIEEMMIQSEKMISVGGLAAGMAHEINNPLSGILQSTQVLLAHLDPERQANRDAAEVVGCNMDSILAYSEKRRLVEFLRAIQDSGARAARIVANMLDFSRKNHPKSMRTDINELLEKVLELALSDYDLKKKYDFKLVHIIRDFDPDLPKAACDASEIEQVFFNLVKNAAQAMAGQEPPNESQTITIRTSHTEAEVRIEVEDNGPGMSEDVRKRIFEPFFTTKPVGEGTGLGLAVSYFIVVTNHGGTFEVHSKPGAGTRFVVSLPISREIVTSV